MADTSLPSSRVWVGQSSLSTSQSRTWTASSSRKTPSVSVDETNSGFLAEPCLVGGNDLSIVVASAGLMDMRVKP